MKANVRARRRDLRNDEGVSVIIGAILVLAIFTSVAIAVRISFVPVWEKEQEIEFMNEAHERMGEVRSALGAQLIQGGATVHTFPLRPEARQFVPSHQKAHLEFREATSQAELYLPRLFEPLPSTVGTLNIRYFNENFQPVDVSDGLLFEDVVDPLSLRVMIDVPDGGGQNDPCHPSDQTQWPDVRVAFGEQPDDPADPFEAEGTWRFHFGDAEGGGGGGSECLVFVTVTDDVNSETVYDNPIGFHRSTNAQTFYQDVMQWPYQFDRLLYLANHPNPDNIDETQPKDIRVWIAGGLVDEVQGSLVEESAVNQDPDDDEEGQGIVKTKIRRNHDGGTLFYVGETDKYVRQDLLIENGLQVIQQDAGQHVLVEPRISLRVIERTHKPDFVEVVFELPTLVGEEALSAGGDIGTVSLIPNETETLRGFAPSFYFNITTEHASVWQDVLQREMAEIDIDALDYLDGSADIVGDELQFELIGTHNNALKVTVRQADIEVGLGTKGTN